MAIVKLRKLDRSDIPLFYKWWNDEELRKLTSGSYEKMSEMEIEKTLLKHLDNQSYHDFIICVDDIPVGHILVKKDKQNRFIFYIAIGEKGYWDKGVGTQATNLTLDWFFDNFAGENLVLEVNQDNLRAIRCYEKVGFKKIGENKSQHNKPLFVMVKNNPRASRS